MKDDPCGFLPNSSPSPRGKTRFGRIITFGDASQRPPKAEYVVLLSFADFVIFSDQSAQTVGANGTANAALIPESPFIRG
jgi:hypothetical protein